jgi:sugar (pentulose or hexulose) kinase
VGQGYLMGLDLGGGGVRCLLVDVESGARTTAARPVAPRPAPGLAGIGWDLDLAAIWAQLGAVAREARQTAGVGPERVLGVAVSAVRLATVVLEDEGEMLLAATNRDARAAAEAIALAVRDGPALHDASGHWPLPISPASRLLWLFGQKPERAARAWRMLSLSDWVAWRLSGLAAAEVSQAGGSLLLDLAAQHWSDEWIGRLDLPPGLLPPLREPGSRLGGLRAEAAEHLGLRAGTPVGVGGADTQCALLGAGATAPGQVAAVLGTTASLQAVLERPRVDPARRLWTGHHLVSNRWVLESNAGPLGEALDWLAEILFPEADPAVGALFAEAACAEPGAGGMLSTLGAGVMDGRSLLPPTGHLAVCHLGAGRAGEARARLARAVVEGAAYAVRANLEQIGAAGGADPEQLQLAGGMTRDPGWTRLLADVCGRPVAVAATTNTSALGAAFLAGVAAGVFHEPGEAAERLALPARRWEPHPGRSRIYDELYGTWQRLREARADADALAAGLMIPWITRARSS